MGCCLSSAAPTGERRGFHEAYKLGRKVGEGAFGQVRAVKPWTADGELAVKIIDVRDGAAFGDGRVDAHRLAAARNEVCLWSGLGTSEHCVHFHASFFDKPLYYMVMERCVCSLLDKLSEASTVTEAQLTRVFSEMLLGIEHVHRADVVHRDVKPDNFLLGGPEGTTVKLCDFGLAAQMPRKRLLKAVCGTAPYMSPEMLGGCGYGKLTDTWSFGAVAYLMIHGDFPYMPLQPTAASVKKAIMAGRPEIRFSRPGEERLFSRAFLERATPFLRALLQRTPTSRRSAGEALALPFLGADAQKPVAAAVTAAGTAQALLRPVMDKARKATLELNMPISPILQRNLDELLQKLQDRRGPSQYFSEASDGEQDKCLRSQADSSEERIRRGLQFRHRTHSGVISHSGILTMVLEEEEEEAEPETASTTTPSSGSDAGRSPHGSCASGGGGRPRAHSMPDAMLAVAASHGQQQPWPSLRPPLPRKPPVPLLDGAHSD